MIGEVLPGVLLTDNATFLSTFLSLFQHIRFRFTRKFIECDPYRLLTLQNQFIQLVELTDNSLPLQSRLASVAARNEYPRATCRNPEWSKYLGIGKTGLTFIIRKFCKPS